jgi:ribosome biogenesis GTPase
LQSDLQVITVNGKDLASAGRLAAWCGQGKTVALMGSSGVGKSTLIKTLTGSERIITQAVREGDGKGATPPPCGRCTGWIRGLADGHARHA